uniref:nucleotidyltransferase family protein n=1 Tax=Amycolatopsis lexingtonensis TaxID=218822 RepID=UPI0013020E27
MADHPPATGPQVAGLLLAAGAGRRFGGPKALAELDGEPLVRRALRTLTAAGCTPIRVVLGAAADQVRPLLPDPEAAVFAEDWQTGMGASLRAGDRSRGCLRHDPREDLGAHPREVDQVDQRGHRAVAFGQCGQARAERGT